MTINYLRSVVCTPPIIRHKAAGAAEYSVFLAGTIEMGNSLNWQAAIIEELKTSASIIYNPRRDDWDSSWKQDLEDPQFNNQVNWELQMLEEADVVVMYFDPTSKSPISLLELGLLAAKKPSQCFVCCPEGFWRKGNVDIVCDKYGIKMYESLIGLTTAVRLHCARVHDHIKVDKK